jgi:hypothetical protein
MSGWGGVDINMLITDSDIGVLQGKINKVTTELECWFNKNNLVINTNKTGIISFYNKHKVHMVKTLRDY